MTVSALDPDDSKSAEVWVAGPAALLVAKVTKISERLGGSRVIDKDALDALRLLRATPTNDLALRMVKLRRHELSAEVAEDAITQLETLFTTDLADGIAMIVRAGSEGEDPATLAASTTSLTEDLLQVLRSL